MLFKPDERAFALTIEAIDYANPFQPERVALERAALRAEYVEVGEAKALSVNDESNPNTLRLCERCESLLRDLRTRSESQAPTAEDLRCVEPLVLFAVYHRWVYAVVEVLEGGADEPPAFSAFRDDFERECTFAGQRILSDFSAEHAFALFFQVGRAFFHIYRNIVGTSSHAVRLRAAVWESIFTHDMRRYQRSLYRRMSDISTLITGPSGTGKELVARAIALSGYLPFRSKPPAFAYDEDALFLTLNLSSLSPTLIESELFGHSRGSFTGATQARPGWFETCTEHGTVFLDEIGDVDAAIQVKLLRILQTREFQRLGETEARQFCGKIVSATNRDVAEEMNRGRFREDFYYRVCSDRITTPALAEQIGGSRDELHHLLLFAAERLLADEAESLAAEALEWIEKSLGLDYAWPGNFRELEQCVRSVLVRKAYHPPEIAAVSAPKRLARNFTEGSWTAEELLAQYCTLVYARTGTYEAAARALHLDRRTVKAKVRPELLKELRIDKG